MGVLVDIVPNHIGVETAEANPWWADVLAHGRDSRFASYFDVDWAAGGGRIRTGEDLNYRRFFTIDPGRDPGRGSVRFSRPAMSRSDVGSTRASSTGCGWTTRTASATRAATSTTWRR